MENKELQERIASHELTWWEDKKKVELITRTVAKGASMDELAMFLYTAKRTGLDPLTRQIFFVKRGGKVTIQTGIDGYRAIAERTGQLAGIDDAVYDSEEQDTPKKATVTVYRMVNGNRVPFTATARWSEYCPPDKLAFMWKKMPYLMLGKCAESLALRKAFPNDLSGLYTNEEMDQAGRGAPSVDVKEGVIEEEPKQVKQEVIDVPKSPVDQVKEAILQGHPFVEGVDMNDFDSMKKFVEEKTGLELVEKNYQAIIEKLNHK